MTHPAMTRPAMARDDFPYSLRVYARREDDAWTLFLYRATDEGERVWLREHGFVLRGRVWVQGSAPDTGVERAA